MHIYSPIIIYVFKTVNVYIDSKFKMEQITSVLSDEKVLHLWDKPTKKLSANQMTILRRACRSKFLIIHGPPGEYSYIMIHFYSMCTIITSVVLRLSVYRKSCSNSMFAKESHSHAYHCTEFHLEVQ